MNIFIFSLLQVLTILIIYLLLKFWLPSYFSEKGKNLATKEDIGGITKEIESVKIVYKQHYDLSKTEQEFYNDAIRVTQNLLASIKEHELTHQTSVSTKTILDDGKLRHEYLSFINTLNNVAARAFVFLNDDGYIRIRDVFSKEQDFSTLRFALLDAMRASIHPKTEMRAEADSRDIKYTVSPDVV